MNEIVINFLLVGENVMPEMTRDNLDLRIVLVDHLLNTKK